MVGTVVSGATEECHVESAAVVQLHRTQQLQLMRKKSHFLRP